MSKFNRDACWILTWWSPRPGNSYCFLTWWSPSPRNSYCSSRHVFALPGIEINDDMLLPTIRDWTTTHDICCKSSCINCYRCCPLIFTSLNCHLKNLTTAAPPLVVALQVAPSCLACPASSNLTTALSDLSQSPVPHEHTSSRCHVCSDTWLGPYKCLHHFAIHAVLAHFCCTVETNSALLAKTKAFHALNTNVAASVPLLACPSSQASLRASDYTMHQSRGIVQYFSMPGDHQHSCWHRYLLCCLNTSATSATSYAWNDDLVILISPSDCFTWNN